VPFSNFEDRNDARIWIIFAGCEENAFIRANMNIGVDIFALDSKWQLRRLHGAIAIVNHGDLRRGNLFELDYILGHKNGRSINNLQFLARTRRIRSSACSNHRKSSQDHPFQRLNYSLSMYNGRKNNCNWSLAIVDISHLRASSEHLPIGSSLASAAFITISVVTAIFLHNLKFRGIDSESGANEASNGGNGEVG
jgi:hypothetical protein